MWLCSRASTSLAALCASFVPCILASACGGAENLDVASGAPEAGPDSTAHANPCGGQASLSFEGASASPSDPCGPCGDGALVCATPNALACVGALPSSVGADSGLGPVDATVLDATVDATVLDANGGPDADADDASAGWQSLGDAGVTLMTVTDGGGSLSVQCLGLATANLVVDPTRGVLYASVTDTSEELGNSVVRIDPASETVTRTVSVGSNPNALAISDDGVSLYVGEDGTASVQRLDVPSGVADPAVYLGDALYGEGPMTAVEIQPVPGSASLYVVSRAMNTDPAFAGLALYDGLTLVDTTDPSDVLAPSITFTSPTVLFGYDNESTGNDLYEFGVGAAGFQAPGAFSNLIPGGGVITSQGGWIFATGGQAINAATVLPEGKYPTSGLVWPDANGTDVWFLTSAPGNVGALEDYDRNAFTLKQSFPMPAAVSASNYPRSLVKWSATGFAFSTGGAVCFIELP